MRLLGEAVGSDRCGVVTSQVRPVSSLSFIYLMAEWHREGITATHDGAPELDLMTWQQFPELYEHLANETVANYLVAELSEPGRSSFESQGASSVVYIPIIVNGERLGTNWF